MATVKFPSEMAPATSIGGNDKLMISKEATGEAYQATFNQAKEYLNITGIELEPLVGGDTSGTALVVAPGPSGEQRTAEVASGKYYDFGSGPQLADADKRWKAYWSGSTWSLKDMGALPSVTVEDDVSQENTGAVSGKGVDDTINKLAKRSPNIIDYMTFQSGIWAESATTHKVVKTASNNWFSVVINNAGQYVGKTLYYQGWQSSITGTTPIVLFADATNTFISQILRQDFNGQITPPAGTDKIYLIGANQTGIGLPENIHNPSANQYINTLMLSEGNSSKPFQSYGSYQIDAGIVVNKYPEMFVQLFPYTAPYSGTKISHEVAHVYERLNGNVYARHLLLYERLDYADFVSGDFLGGEVVRYAGCKLFSYNLDTNTFTDLAKTFIIIPESEFVMNSSAWIGGYHGYENLSAVNFIINNKTYNVSGNLNFTATGLISCKSFSYSVVSKMKLSDKSDYADRVKINDFINGGYQTRSRFKMLKANPFMAYMGIVCVGKYFTQVTSDTSKVVVPSASTLFPIDEDYMSRELLYSSSDYQLSVINRVSESLLDNLCMIRLWDRASDTKFYRQIPNYTPAIGEVFETITEVRIKAIQ